MNWKWFATTIAFGGVLIILLLILFLYYTPNHLGRIDTTYQTENIEMKRVLTFGDSLTAGYTVMYSGSTFHPYADLMNAACSLLQADSIGMSGWTTSQLVESMNELRITDAFHNEGQGLSIALSQKQYDLVCIMAGTNDLGHGLKTELIKENLQRLHDTVLSAGVKSLAIGIPESHYVRAVKSADERRTEVNNFLRELSEKKSDMFYVDCPVNYTKALFSTDGLHFSEEGYKTLSQGILHKITTIPGFEDINPLYL